MVRAVRIPAGVVFAALVLMSAAGFAQSVTALHVFEEADGVYPHYITLGPEGDLFGSTSVGGPAGGPCGSGAGSGCGTIFKIDRRGVFSLVLALDLSNGGAPQSPPYADGNGLIDTSPSDLSNHGALFKVRTNGTGMRNLHIWFTPQHGANPSGPFVVMADGTVYGTTSGAEFINGTGKAYDANVLYKASPGGGAGRHHLHGGAVWRGFHLLKPWLRNDCALPATRRALTYGAA